MLYSSFSYFIWQDQDGWVGNISQQGQNSYAMHGFDIRSNASSLVCLNMLAM